MQSHDRDAAALWDIAEAIREIQQFMAGVSEMEYLETLWLRRVVERNFEILGEAARRVSTEFQRAHPDVDWGNMIGLRNIIAHHYEQVDHEILWDIMNTVLPEVLVNVERFLSELSGQSS
ncbi:HepT-like ribonuclease domain-containing protein [Leptolyngbya sp. GGD]|uniref:HepT-like ribonuclease domain-containing protein n=1 Tax=Leptolyngbya sp. GGD TaxID=2997907 RepID=UPI00227AF8C3|nr:HepT-like ribonuclease domain-containing protein [Leptolyngbya sp. GGD]MCY6490096.1 DUF86 domain-containing protein [Leptolyngbya sp. GGD]